MSASKPVLYLLAGLLCDEALWAPVAGVLAEDADVRIVSFPGQDSIAAMAGQVLAQAPDRFALAGHSMGGRVALELCRQSPGRVERLALLNTGVHPAGPHEPQTRGALVALARREGMAALTAEWLPPMMARRSLENVGLMQNLAAMVERATPDGFAAQIQALLHRPDARAGLRTVEVPTLLLSAEDDRWSPVEQHRAMLADAPHGSLVVIGEAGHMAPVEQPDAVATALRTWLREPN